MNGYLQNTVNGKSVFFLIIFLFFSIICIPQSKEDLEKKQKRMQKDIDYKNKLLKETKKNQQLSSIQLVILNKKITSRQQLISTIQYETRLIEQQINEHNALIESLHNDLVQLKDEYAKMIYFAYKNRNAYDRLMFLFASEDFNQAYQRLKYLQQYSAYRKTQAEMIVKTQGLISVKLTELEASRHEKRSLIGLEQTEKHKLTGEKEEQQTTLHALKKKETQLRQQIKKSRDEAKKLQRAIERIIEEEMNAKGKNYFALTPEAKQLSISFAGNRGKLPWPVKKGEITEYFGEHPHPVLKQVTVKNNGININTTAGSKARAVFNGQVTGVVIIPGSGKVVMVRHGEYISIYSNLKNVFVKKGDKVTTKQDIGSIITDGASGKTELHFELWKRKTILNPSPWIYRAK